MTDDDGVPYLVIGHLLLSSESISCRSDRKNGSTSVTRPTVWKLPRSLSLITVEGLMSMQTTLVQAGSRLPTATEWSMVAIIRQKLTSRTRARRQFLPDD